MAFTVKTPGFLTTVQDLGRRGFLAWGFPENGACDKYSLRLANLLCGNPEPEAGGGPGFAGLECTVQGPELEFDTEEVIALTGADMGPKRNGTPVPMYAPVRMAPGDRLTFEPARSGFRGYVAFLGGVDVPAVQGSRSTNLQCGMGGYHGRPLMRGDRLETGPVSPDFKSRWAALAKAEGAGISLEALEEFPLLRMPSAPVRLVDGARLPVLRAVPGPQQEAFTEEGLELFQREIYRVSVDSGRMGCRLEGTPVPMRSGADIVSDGIVEGSVQISGSGLPIVMMADHQTTGGYAKIATVIRADLPVLAQLGPGKTLSFRFVSWQEGTAAFRREEEKTAWIRQWLRPRLDRAGG